MSPLLRQVLILLLAMPQAALQAWVFCRLFYVHRPARFTVVYTLVIFGVQLPYSLAEAFGTGSLLAASRMVLTTAAMTALFCWSSQERKSKAVLFGLMLMGSTVLTDLVYSQLFLRLVDENLVEYFLGVSLPALVAVKVSFFFFLLLVYFLFCRVWRRLVQHGETGHDAPFVLFVLGECVSLLFLEYFLWWMQPAVPMTVALLLLLAGLLLAAGVLLLRLFSKAREYYEAQNRQSALAGQLELQRARLHELESGSRRVAQLRTSLEDQVAQAREALAHGALPQARNAMDCLEQQVRSARGLSCENVVVDAVAADKARRCQAEGIALVLRLALPQDLPLDGPTLCSVFANLLDNAMEACLRLPAEARQITCSAVCRGGYLIVQERNPLPPPLDAEARRRRRADGRGLGLEILEQIARRYDGMVEICREDGQFQITVWLKLAAPAKEGAP